MKQEPYARLLALSKERALLASLQALAEWDLETHMPKKGISLRSQQIELLASMLHRQHTGPRFAKALRALIDLETGEIKNDRLSAKQLAALREYRRDYLREARLPNAFVRKLAETTSLASHVWKEAKQHNHFARFAPHLEKIVSLQRKKADFLGFQEHPYDALVELYEPDTTTHLLSTLFTRLKTPLTSLLKQIANCQNVQNDFLFFSAPSAKQWELSLHLLRRMGLEEESFRLDLAAHPFCSALCCEDIRMGTRILPHHLFSCLSSILHEGGHALYDQGLLKEHFGSPLGEAASLGIHESQSRWWETRVGSHLSFAKYLLPLLQKMFPEPFAATSAHDLYYALNKVNPHLIRVEADEVSYNLHIILRFEIEKGLVEGSLHVQDLPDIWNEKMRETFGISPDQDGEGVLQDIHWSLGLFGYFPTYALGNLFAAQFFSTFEQQNGSWADDVQQGNFDPMRNWLKEHIHQHGRCYTPKELCMKITGKELSEQPFVDYLQNKYTDIYKL